MSFNKDDHFQMTTFETKLSILLDVFAINQNTLRPISNTYQVSNKKSNHSLIVIVISFPVVVHQIHCW